MSIQHLLRNNIKNLKAYASARDEFQGNSTRLRFLDANENPYNTGFNRYPDPKQLQLKALLSKHKKCRLENIVLGNGSDEILDLIIRAFCEPNRDSIITLPPTYGMYEVLATINAVAVKKINLSLGFQPQVDAILEATTPRTKILFLCTPNNPTGNSFTEQAMEELLLKFKGIIVIDEAYIDFSNQKSWLEKLDQFPNLIITQTFSKAYGLAGIRLGVCYASEEITEVLNRIKPPYNVNVLTQKKAFDRLLEHQLVQTEINQIKTNRAQLIEALKHVACIEEIYPSDSNFVLVKVDHATKRYHELVSKGIVIRNRTNEPLCTNCLRLTVGNEEDNVLLITSLQALK
ncbi:histidinol-phosphate transaminase [Bizionia paragorgiae]|uniref:histidinol-phosphate transaminase n=1 Tax=Bizionia paragorgiae TaxID=283786 RepID=UPI00299E980E|nr:histidinol-phosphate transaminase [Bizionia paragorgiae]MDX1270758.1 histidinol-phosphate transaminase [Bizionia paragorgiae]